MSKRHWASGCGGSNRAGSWVSPTMGNLVDGRLWSFTVLAVPPSHRSLCRSDHAPCPHQPTWLSRSERRHHRIGSLCRARNRRCIVRRSRFVPLTSVRGKSERSRYAASRIRCPWQSNRHWPIAAIMSAKSSSSPEFSPATSGIRLPFHAAAPLLSTDRCGAKATSGRKTLRRDRRSHRKPTTLYAFSSDIKIF